MISNETLVKISKDDELSALKAMHTLEKFCLDMHDCRKCPFFCPLLVVYGYESECYLTRTNAFTPADWSVGSLSNVEEG